VGEVPASVCAAAARDFAGTRDDRDALVGAESTARTANPEAGAGDVRG
jgi:hypothetical protein